GGVVLVEADEQIGQLAADGLGAQQRGQLGEVDKPVGVPAGPVIVGAVDNPEHLMVGLARLVEQSADLFGGGCHLLPCSGRPVASKATAWHVRDQGPRHQPEQVYQDQPSPAPYHQGKGSPGPSLIEAHRLSPVGRWMMSRLAGFYIAKMVESAAVSGTA